MRDAALRLLEALVLAGEEEEEEDRGEDTSRSLTLAADAAEARRSACCNAPLRENLVRVLGGVGRCWLTPG